MEATLDAVKRDTRGKNEARRLRVNGQMPAVLYGGRDDRVAEPIAVDPKALMKILHSESGLNTLISLSVAGGAATRVLMKEHQLDPITHRLLHADFYRVAMDKLLTVTVQIELKGEPKGVKQQGGLLDFVHREIEVECLPADIPESIEVDVSELVIGQAIRLREIDTGGKWKPLSEPDLMIVHVVPPRAEEAPAEEAAAAVGTPAEPEVIKKGKTDKEEDEKEK
jgi:large subunit ribosomal protein L25